MATTLTVTAIADYVKEHKDELLVKAALGGKSLEYADIMTNVAFKDAIPYLDSEIVLGDGSECGFTPDGSDVFGKRFIETHPVKVHKEYCNKDFRKTIYGEQIKWEAGRLDLPVAQKIAESNMNKIQDAVEDMVWQGNSTVGVTGWIADAGEASVEFAEGASASAKVDAMVAALTVAMLKKGVNLFMSYTDFRAYVQESNSTCCANRPIVDAASESIKYVGDSRITIVPVLGLEGTGNMVAASAKNLIYATDIENSENVYKMAEDEKEDKTWFKVEFLAGTAVRYKDEVILGA